MPKMKNDLAVSTAPVPDLPRLLPLQDAVLKIGLSRSSWYREHKKGNVRLLKFGAATYLDTESALAFLASLPAMKSKSAA